MWTALSNERMGLLFIIAPDSRQLCHSRVRVPRHSWPYFTVSDSRLPQTGGSGLRIYIPQEQDGPVYPQDLGSLFVASYNSQSYGGGIRTHLHTLITQISYKVKVKIMLRPTLSRPVCLGIKHHLGLKTRSLLLSDSCRLVDVGRSLRREDGSSDDRSYPIIRSSC
jgi:hypothetical protein